MGPRHIKHKRSCEHSNIRENQSLIKTEISIKKLLHQTSPEKYKPPQVSYYLFCLIFQSWNTSFTIITYFPESCRAVRGKKRFSVIKMKQWKYMSPGLFSSSGRIIQSCCTVQILMVNFQNIPFNTERKSKQKKTLTYKKKYVKNIHKTHDLLAPA